MLHVVTCVVSRVVACVDGCVSHDVACVVSHDVAWFVGGSTLVQIWGILLWPRVIGPDMVKWWFSWVWSDDISFTFGAVGVQLVVVRWFSKGYDVVQ